MIVTFCGHADFKATKRHEERVLEFLEEKLKNINAEFYLGANGEFDKFAFECCKKYKKNHPDAKLVFVTPYINVEYQKNHLDYCKTVFDVIIYPEIENKPPRFAITYRNRYMVEKADWVIAYVSHEWGGAHATYLYAKRKGKPIFNLAD